MPQSTATGASTDPFRITVVCLGNICRSPIGQAVLQARIERLGLEGQITIDSAGTGDWHVGHEADVRARAILQSHGYFLTHRARQIDPSWMNSINLLLAMDTSNFRDLGRMVEVSGQRTPLRMFRSFDPANLGVPDGDSQLDVPDPYYGDSDGFEVVLRMLEAASDGLVAQLPDLIVEAKAGG